ncbi:MAG TPA: twin-arginine translocation signal domain-containing protein, partial [Reyranella sp.]|nr:twin-arginine translocation signal domain-containing protein [Reyranella sp.]
MPHRRHFLFGAAALAAAPAQAQPVKISLGTATPGGGFPVYG